jgi:hypothetical protein
MEDSHKLEEEKFREQYVRPFFRTKGYKKMLNYFSAIVRSDHFKEFVAECRNRYKIPQNGLEPFKVTDHSGVAYRMDKHKRIEISIGGYPLIPKGYCVHTEKDLYENVELFCDRYSLYVLDWQEAIIFFIFYNKIVIPEHSDAYNLCHVSDIKHEKEEPFEEKTQQSINAAFPIVIRISPYASQNDIVDYIKNAYRPSILPLQEKYQDKTIKIGSIKSRRSETQKRNDFIYEKRHLPRKEIMRLLKGLIDEGHIAKIISIEKKRRKEL